MFTAAQLAAAVSPETAIVIQDYPYGFRLRCMMRVWIEYREGKGFRYCTQTTNPKKPFTVWNAPKRSTYCRVASVIGQDENGHVSHAACLTEYSSLPEYVEFMAKHGANLCDHARASVAYYMEAKTAYENKSAELGVSNIYEATPEQRREIMGAAYAVTVAHVKAGTAY